MSTSSSIVKDYRQILRHIRSLPSHTTLKRHVIAQFQQGKRDSDTKQIALNRELVHNYATIVSSVKELKYLRGLDSGEKLDPRDKIRATAARVGLSVPKFADEAFPNSTDSPDAGIEIQHLVTATAKNP